MQELERIARSCCTIPPELEVYEKGYVIALKGLYCQHDHKKITLEQAREEKKVLLELYKHQKGNRVEENLKLNKKAIIDAVILELGRYISCATTNHDREKAYPRQLFEKRIVEVINEACDLKVSC